MMPWPPLDSLQAVSMDAVGNLKPCEVLYEFEGPCIFRAETALRISVLAYLTEELEDEGLLRYILSTTSSGTIDDLKRGVISVREALDRGSLWLVDFNFAWEPQRAFAVRPDQLPEDALPLRGTMLWSSLEPEFAVRLQWDEHPAGRVPAGAFKQAAEIASNALKPVFEWAARHLRVDASGRPPEWLRDLYALPAQRVAFGSLEVAFARIDVSAASQAALPLDQDKRPTPAEIQEEGWSAIREGLAWATSDGAVPTGDGEEQKWHAVLESLQRLAPPSTGPVMTVEVWGSSIVDQDRRVTLDRRSTKRIRTALTRLKKRHEVQLRVFTGLIRSLDLDKLTLILRDVIGEEGDVSVALDDEDLLETAREAHYQVLQVNVAARSEDKKAWYATEIEFVATEDESDVVDVD